MGARSKKWRKAAGRTLRHMGLKGLAVAFLHWWEQHPLFLTNFVFQRIIGINRDCPWSVHFTSRVVDARKIRVHPSSRLSFAVSGNCYLQGLNGIEIGEGTIFGPGVRIISANHSEMDFRQSVPERPVRIGRRCWIGANAVVLPGVELGDRVVVGAGSVVTKSFPGGSVLAGVPAKVIRQVQQPQDASSLHSDSRQEEGGEQYEQP